MKKFLAASFALAPLHAGLFALSEPDSAPFGEESGGAGAKEIAIAAGDVFVINMAFNSGARIILQEDYSEINLDTMKKNLGRYWCWDKDGFFMNQFGHPYQGSLYFNAGRSNGLHFWQSFLVTAGGSLMWEEFGETTTPAVNDFITTPMCGSLVGEMLHRLYLDANELCPALAWLLSPIDAVNATMKGRQTSVSGRTEEIDFVFHGGADYSKVNFSEKLDSETEKRLFGGGAIHIQYGNPIAHTSKEALDLFTVDLDSTFSSDFYKVDFCLDGFLYSRAFYFEEREGTLGVNLLYEGERSSEMIFSNAALGLKYWGELPFFDTDGTFTFFAQVDGIFLGTRGLYRLSQDIRLRTDISDRLNPPRSYNFGGGALLKAGFSAGSEKFGTLYGEAEANFLIPYIYSKLEESEATKHFMTRAQLGYEHKVTEHFALGLRDTFICKADWFKNEADTVQILNSAQLYGKIAFRRK